jgi:hypothetical protein
LAAGNNSATVHDGDIKVSKVEDISVPPDSEQVLLGSRDL